MLLVFKADPVFSKQSQALAVLTRFAQFGARMGCEPGGGYHVLIHTGKRPLGVLRQLKHFDPAAKWRLYGLDDDGVPRVPIEEDGDWLSVPT